MGNWTLIDTDGKETHSWDKKEETETEEVNLGKDQSGVGQRNYRSSYRFQKTGEPLCSKHNIIYR